MYKPFATLSLLLAAASFSTAPAQGVIESFEDPNEWVVGGNDITSHGATVDLALETSDFTEGTGAIAITYDYSGNANFEIGMTKNYSPPLDLSGLMELSIDIKGDANSEVDITWYMLLYDTSGQALKVYAGTVEEGGRQVRAPKADGWKRYTFSLAEITWSEWGNTAHVAPSLSNIASITFLLQKNSVTGNDAETTVLVDNLQYSTTSSRMTTGIIDQFNYASTAAMEAVWSENYSGGSGAAQSSISLNTTNVFEGSGAMQIDYDMADGAQNYSTGQRMPLAEAWDVSGIDVFEIAFHGDSGFPANAGPLVMIALQDSVGNRARWRVTNGMRVDEYNRFILFTKQDAPTQWGATNAWEEEQWDAGGDLNKTDVTKVVIYMIDGGTAYPYQATVLVDDFKYHTSTGQPIESAVGGETTVQNWFLY